MAEGGKSKMETKVKNNNVEAEFTITLTRIFLILIKHEFITISLKEIIF